MQLRFGDGRADIARNGSVGKKIGRFALRRVFPVHGMNGETCFARAFHHVPSVFIHYAEIQPLTVFGEFLLKLSKRIKAIAVVRIGNHALFFRAVVPRASVNEIVELRFREISVAVEIELFKHVFFKRGFRRR